MKISSNVNLYVGLKGYCPAYLGSCQYLHLPSRCGKYEELVSPSDLKVNEGHYS
jgi:hypothetical protein